MANFKGYVGDRKNNTGEDRGYVIHTDRDLWKRYSLDSEKEKYQVVVTQDNDETVLGHLYVELVEPKMEYVILQVNGGTKQCLYPGDSLTIDPKDTINVLDIKTNVPANEGVQAFLKSSRTKVSLFTDAEAIPRKIASGNHKNGSKFKIDVERERAVLGSITLDLENKGVRHGG